MTLLDDFKQFVTDAQDGTQYRNWVRDNSGLKADQKNQDPLPPPVAGTDVAKWYAFRDAIVAGQRPTVPAMSSPHGRELIDAGVQYLDATVTITPPPPPPPVSGKRIGNGFVTDLQGTRYSQMTDTERANYGGVTVGFGNEIDIATFEKTHPGVHGFGYQTSVEIGSNNWYGAVLIDVARQHGWILKTASGAEVTNGQGLAMADIGHPDYQTAWCDYEKSRAAVTGLKRKFLDNVTGAMMVGTQAQLVTGERVEERLRPYHPEAGEDRVIAATHRFASWLSGTPINPRTGQPYTDATWQADYISFLKAQQAQLPDFYRLANAYAGDRLSWWKAIAPYVDGLMYEYWPGDSEGIACLKAAQNAGKDPWILVDPGRQGASPDNTAGIALAKTFAANWDKKGGGFGFVGTNMWRTGAGSWTAAIAA